MLLTSFDPFFTDFDRMARRAFGWADWNTGTRSALPMDVIRRDDEVVLKLDLPGFDPASIEVTTDHDVLTISARKSQEHTEGDRPVLRERLTGSFTRKIRLAETVDTEKIAAGYENGVLSISLPLQEKAQPRKVEITGTSAPALTA